MNANLFALLSDNIADPAATAIETAAGERMLYADLVARTGKMANALAGLGVKPGDRVAAQVEKSVEAIVLYLGTVRAGGAFLPLNTGYSGRDRVLRRRRRARRSSSTRAGARRCRRRRTRRAPRSSRSTPRARAA